MDQLRYNSDSITIIADNLNITESEARERVRHANFSEYSALLEANVDKQQDHPQHRGSEPTKSNNEFRIPNEYGSDDELEFVSANDGQRTFRDKQGKLHTLSPTNGNGEGRIEKALRVAKGLSNQLKQGYNKGLNETDIARMKELAGIAETTTSGSIAASPSIIGDTSDSHKPTVQLRKRLRLEREKREKDKIQAEKSSKKDE